MRPSSRFLITFAAIALPLAALLAGRAAAKRAPGPVAAPAPPAPANPSPIAPVTEQMQAFYEQSSSFDADFTQEYWIKRDGLKKTANGQVTFKKPGKMCWRFDIPEGNRVVSDGKKLKVYQKAEKQMFEQAVNASQYAAALSFLAGQGKLADTFDFQLFDGEQMSFPGSWVLVGTPKTSTPAYENISFYVEKQTSRVRRVRILDGQGNSNRFDFDNATLDTKVDESMFVFTPPPGTAIIQVPALPTRR